MSGEAEAFRHGVITLEMRVSGRGALMLYVVGKLRPDASDCRRDDTGTVSLAAGTVVGLAPLLSLSDLSPHAVLKDGGRNASVGRAG